MSKTYWIDLTDLSQWAGHYTGIQRVVFNLSKYYAQRDDVKFFVFDKPRTGFFEVNFDIVHEPPENVEDLGSAENLNVHMLRRVAYAIPSRYKQRIPSSVKKLLRKSYHVAREMKNGHMPLINQGHQKFPRDRKAVFNSSDVVLVLGSPWANPDMMPSLVNAKLEDNFKLIQVIYDLIPVLMPYLFGEALLPEFTRYLFDVVTNSDGLVAISKSSKKDVEMFCERLLMPKKSVGVIRLGDEFVKSVPKQPKVDLQPEEFILCVGTLEIRKNHQLLYYVYKEAKQRNIKLPKLVIVGRRGWLTSDLTYVIQNDSDVNSQIIIMNNASDSNLAWLYENCRFTIYPALYEGWGLPIAESLAYGKVCIASNTSSMVEIAPDLVDHFSPYDTETCLQLILRYTEGEANLRNREAKIREEYGSYNWEDTYEQFNMFVEHLLDH